jgi:hypothetical protein
MRAFGLKTVLTVAFSGTALLAAPTSGIGVAMSEGSISINSASSVGNATIFDGSSLQTGRAASQVRLNDGAQLRLASDSAAKVFTDHVDLQRGSASITGYTANTSGLSIRAEGKSSASVSMRDQGVVEIAALTGDVHVFNAAGLNVANLVPGRALDLKPQDAGASAPSTLTGCAVKSGNNLLFTDETSKVVVQLNGSAVKTNKRVQISGTMVPNATPAAGATQVLSVNSVKDVGGSCNSRAVAAAAAAGPAGAAAAGGAAAGAAVGISAATAGVAVAAGVGVGAAAATGAFTSASTPTVSSGRVGTFQ